METSLTRKPFSCKFLILMHLLLGIGAVFGGVALVADPSGELIGMPVALLESSPFHTFLIPGIILFVVLGIIPLLVAYGLLTRREWKSGLFNLYPAMSWAWTYSLYVGFALIIWITVEVYIIQEIAFVHVFYMAVGLIIQAATLLPSVQRYFAVK